MISRFTFLAIFFLSGFLVVNNIGVITSYVSFYPTDELGADERRINQIKPQDIDAGFKWMWLFLVLLSLALIGFVLFLERDYFEDSFLTLDIYRRLNEVHKLIKKKKFVDAVEFYYSIKTEFNRIHRKRSRLKKRVMKLKDEVELYLKANHAYELAKSNKVGLVKAMNEVLALANKVAEEVPEDIELYKYAKRQYDYCNRRFKK